MIAIIGCGNANRTDDAAGLEVVRILHALDHIRCRPDVRVLDAGTDGMAVMFAARGCTTLIVVDCCKTGADPGAVFEVPGGELENRHEPSLNLHDFRWDHALHAGRKIYRDAFPTDVTAYLIEARSLELGIGLSPDVRAAAATVARQIEARIIATPPGAIQPEPAL
jgi:hydrogenase maturation protease